MQSTEPVEKDARIRLLKAGARFVYRQGYHKTGIQKVVEAAGVPKGSFYFYFKSKEDFGLHLIDHYASLHFNRLDRYVKDSNIPPLQRVRNFFQNQISFFMKNDFKDG